MSQPYSDQVMDHFYNPRSAFRMQDPDLVGQSGVPGHGPFMVLYLKLEGERVAAASFQTYGCAPAIAAGSLLAERLPGTLLNEVGRWTEELINTELGGLPDHKRHCSGIAAQAVERILAARQKHCPPPQE